MSRNLENDILTLRYLISIFLTSWSGDNYNGHGATGSAELINSTIDLYNFDKNVEPSFCFFDETV